MHRDRPNPGATWSTGTAFPVASSTTVRAPSGRASRMHVMVRHLGTAPPHRSTRERTRTRTAVALSRTSTELGIPHPAPITSRASPVAATRTIGTVTTCSLKWTKSPTPTAATTDAAAHRPHRLRGTRTSARIPCARRTRHASTVHERVVLITGANRGIGRGLALAFAARGARVVVTARDVDGGEAVTAEIRDRGGDAYFARCDVTRGDDVDRAVATAVEHYGALDVMIHNAVSVRSSEPHDLVSAPLELWDEHASVSITGAYSCAIAAHRHLTATRGAMLLLTSPAGINGSRNSPFYAGVKGAQRAFVKSLAREWGPDGIRVNGLAPLATTPALAGAFANDPTMEERLTRVIPLGRFGDPEHDIGPAAVFLCSDDARYVTGQTLVVSGGRLTSL